MEQEGWGRWARKMVFGQQGREREYKRKERWREEKGGVRVRNAREEEGWVEIDRI
jgi:hypothetical protein